MADLSVSLFAADILHMEDDLQMLDGLPIFSLHVDIMDGHFVPLCGFNQLWIRKIHKYCPVPMDFHFMAYLDREMLSKYLALKPVRIILHAEANDKKYNIDFLKIIRSRGIEAGIALSPETDPLDVQDYLSEIDDVLVMSSKPGRENTVFDEGIYKRIIQIKNILRDMGKKITISVDGGVNEATAIKCIEVGANRVIMGRAFFGNKEKEKLVNKIIRTTI